MKKPMSRWAIALWVLAVWYGLIQVVGALEVYRMLGPIFRREDWVRLFQDTVRPLFFNGGMLGGLAVLLEMVDQIRWNGLTEDQRLARINRRSFWAILRGWPHQNTN